MRSRGSVVLRQSSSPQTAFSLIELMVVCGIILLIMAFAVPAVTGLSKANNLATGGRIVSNLLTAARSEAINRRALIRFHIATKWPDDASLAYRKITVVQHDGAAGTDTQLAAWETLPTGIVFNPDDPGGTGKYLFKLNQTQNPKLKFAGKDIDTAYIEFLPTGAVNVDMSDSPVRMRLVPGFVSGSQVTTTSANNWFDTSVDALVGRIAISRP